MTPLLLLGGLGAVALYLYSQSSGSSSASSAPPPAVAWNAGTAVQTSNPSGANYMAPAPAGYYPGTGVTNPTDAVAAAAASGATPVANGTPAGTPTGSTTTSGAPLFHTGYSDANSGAVIASDATGNPYLA